MVEGWYPSTSRPYHHQHEIAFANDPDDGAICDHGFSPAASANGVNAGAVRR
jgi:hypothetical protein